MKKITSNNVIQKIILGLVTILTINFVTPNYTYAGFWEDVGTGLLKELAQLVGAVCDVVMGTFNNFLLGASGMSSAMLDKTDINFTNSNSWLYYDSSQFDPNAEGSVVIDVNDLNSKGLFDVTDWEVPNMMYSPENIFANKIAMLDVNFLNPGMYTSAIEGNTSPESIAYQLRGTISKWYKGFRSIAIVILLSVLVYLGIRILISSTAVDKAKYKESIKNWFVALVLVFTMQFIMSGILMLVDNFTKLFSNQINDGIIVQVEGYAGADGRNFTFRTNLMGLVRFKAQSDTWQDATAYVIMYVALVIYTGIFTFQYLKRVLWMAFFTMISPLVAMTYPIDKIGDGRSQAFNLWFKEYTMNAIIQPVHLLLYTVLLGSSLDLAAENQLYAIVALLFLIPAEKFIKKMFGISSETAEGFGSFAGGALTMSLLQALSKDRLHKGSKGNGGGKKSSDDSSDEDNTMTTTSRPKIGIFNSGNLANITNPTGGMMVSSNDNSNNSNGLNGGITTASSGDNSNNSNGNNNNTNGYFTNGNDNTYGNRLINDQNSYNGLVDTSNYSWNSPNDNDEYTYGSIPAENLSEYGNDGWNGMRYRGQYPGTEPNPPQVDIPEQREIGFRQKAGAFGKATLGLAKRKHLGRFTGNIMKGVAKGALRGAGMGMGAMIGLGAGITTGDFSNAMKYMATGAVAGNMIGKNTYNLGASLANGGKNIVDSVKNRDGRFTYDYEEALYGTEQAQNNLIKRENEKAREKFLKNDAEIRKYKQMTARINEKERKAGRNLTSYQDLMNAGFDYKEKGFGDKDIEKALSMEVAHGGIGTADRDSMMAIMDLKDKYGSEYILDDKKSAQFDKVLDKELGGNEQVKEQVKTLFEEAHGLEGYHLINRNPQGNEGRTNQGERNTTPRGRNSNQRSPQTNNSDNDFADEGWEEAYGLRPYDSQ